jgi:hypothetical protein
MRTEQQQLHELYGKHEPGPKVYQYKGLAGDALATLTQCPCGDWLVRYKPTYAWEPLDGPVAAYFINDYPELYPLLKAWWPDRPDTTLRVDWGAIDRSVSRAIRTFYKPAAKPQAE